MTRHLIFSTILCTLIGCGSDGSTQNIPQQNLNQNPTPTQDAPKKSTTQQVNISVGTCIQETLKIREKTTRSLEKLSCSNLTDRDFTLLSTLPTLKSLTINDTPLTAMDIQNIANNVIDHQLTTLILENDNLTKSSIDNIDPKWNNSYGSEHFTSLKYLSLKNNHIEGLLVIDYFPQLETLDLRGNTYPSNRLHHIGFVENLKTFYLGGNPNIEDLKDMRDGPSAEASIETMDISDLPALKDISELRNFRSLQTLTIDTTQKSRFADTLTALRAKGVTILTIQ